MRPDPPAAAGVKSARMSVFPNPTARTNPVGETVATSVEQVHGTVAHCAIDVTSLVDQSVIVAMAVSWLVCPIAVRFALPPILRSGMMVLEGPVGEHAVIHPNARLSNVSAANRSNRDFIFIPCRSEDLYFGKRAAADTGQCLRYSFTVAPLTSTPDPAFHEFRDRNAEGAEVQ